MEEQENVVEEQVQETQETEDVFQSAEEAYGTEEVGEEVDPESHVEPEVIQEPYAYDLHTVKLPHRYRETVKGHFDGIVKGYETKAQEAQNIADEQKTANAEIVNALKGAITNPNTLRDLAIKYGEQVGIDPKVIQQYQQMNQQEQPEQPAKQDLSSQVFAKYQDALLNETDPKKWVALQNQMVADSMKVGRHESRGEFTNLLKEALGAYHEKFVKPTLTEGQERREIVAHNDRKSSWSTATDKVKEKYSDFDTHKEAVLKLMSEDPYYSRITQDINDNPGKFDKNAHEIAMERAYKLVVREDKNWQGGLKPSVKHVTTKAKISDSDPFGDVERQIYPENFE